MAKTLTPWPHFSCSVIALTASFLGTGANASLVQPGERVIVDIPARPDENGKPTDVPDIRDNLELIKINGPSDIDLPDERPDDVPEGAIKSAKGWLVPTADGTYAIWNAPGTAGASLPPPLGGEDVNDRQAKDNLIEAVRAASGEGPAPDQSGVIPANLDARVAQDAKDAAATDRSGLAAAAGMNEPLGPDPDGLDKMTPKELRDFIVKKGGPVQPSNASKDDLLALAKSTRDKAAS